MSACVVCWRDHMPWCDGWLDEVETLTAVEETETRTFLEYEDDDYRVVIPCAD